MKKLQQYVEQNYFVERELDKVVQADRARLASMGAWRGRKFKVSWQPGRTWHVEVHKDFAGTDTH